MGSKLVLSFLLVVVIYVCGISATYFGGGGGGGGDGGGHGGVGAIWLGYDWGRWECVCRRGCYPNEYQLANRCIFPPFPHRKMTCCRRVRDFGYGGYGGGFGGYSGGFGYGGADGYGYRVSYGKGSY